jgi:thiol:disulfide interchange protein DsbD
MESKLLPRPEVAAKIGTFIPVELFTDGEDAASARNKKLQENMFGTVALPLYAVITPDGQKLAEFPGLTRNPTEFLDFLKQGEIAAMRVAQRPATGAP